MVTIAEYKKRLALSEHDEQALVCEYLEAYKIPFFAIPNSAKRSIRLAAYEKKQGLKSGVPDLFIATPRHSFGGMFIEMKRRNGKLSDVTKNQNEWINTLRQNNYFVVVAFGAEAAIKAVERYL